MKLQSVATSAVVYSPFSAVILGKLEQTACQNAVILIKNQSIYTLVIMGLFDLASI